MTADDRRRDVRPVNFDVALRQAVVVFVFFVMVLGVIVSFLWLIVATLTQGGF